MRRADSHPVPARKRPKVAIIMLGAAQSINTPIMVTDQVRRREYFLPKLSVMNRKVTYPIKAPT